MRETEIEALVIGAGHAGLNTSRALQAAGIEHLVLERGSIGESWRSQRWDSFCVNTPNWANGLLDFDYAGDEPSDFFTADSHVDQLGSFAIEFSLPIRENTEVSSVTRERDDRFKVTSGAGEIWITSHLVVCSGSQNVPLTPDLANDLPSSVTQLHAADYRSPESLGEGAVLVIGSAQTGAQIAEELAEFGRTTYLCTSKVGRAPRRYRGRDLIEWMKESGLANTTVDQLPDPAMQYAKQAIISGTKGGHPMSLQSLGRCGVTLLGRLEAVAGNKLTIGDQLASNVTFADEASAGLKAGLDAFIDGAGIGAEAASEDEVDMPLDTLNEMAEIRELDLEATEITTVIWATGFGGDFSFLKFDVGSSPHGTPAHDDGVSPIPGLYYVGFPWLRTRTSGLIFGSREDAVAISERIAASS